MVDTHKTLDEWTQRGLERLRRVKAGEDIRDVYGTREPPPGSIGGEWGRWHQLDAAKAQMQTDQENLADAYLAEHKADDDQPIDEAWLRACGFTNREVPDLDIARLRELLDRCTNLRDVETAKDHLFANARALLDAAEERDRLKAEVERCGRWSTRPPPRGA